MGHRGDSTFAVLFSFENHSLCAAVGQEGNTRRWELPEGAPQPAAGTRGAEPAESLGEQAGGEGAAGSLSRPREPGPARAGETRAVRGWPGRLGLSFSRVYWHKRAGAAACSRRLPSAPWAGWQRRACASIPCCCMFQVDK